MNLIRMTAGMTVAVGLSCVAGAADDAWRTDFDAAKTEAAKDGKDLLVDFSGSDWCGWCQKLDAEVFGKPEFLEPAKKEFVLCVLDFPNKPENRAKIPEARQARNRELMTQYHVQGFPSVLLFDGRGELYARTGYRPGGAAAYMGHLQELKKGKKMSDELFARARQPDLAGADKAKALDAALSALSPSMAAEHRAEMEEIVQLDADGALGLRTKYRKQVLLVRAGEARRARDLAGALKIYDEILDEIQPTGGELQDLLMEKSSMHFASGDKDKAKSAMDAALAAAPDSPNAPRIRDLRQRIFPDDAPPAAP